MFSPEIEAQDTELNRLEVQNRIQFDGRLMAPIDLSLENTHQLKLEPLIWKNLDDPPTKMKISNTGETVIVSAKWGQQRPYLTGGPLVGNYVFSQIHFHWGGNEHEGSEHTVRGIAYPMEMHVVLYKTRYLTQEAALKHEDGVIILVYLAKLSGKSSSGIQWLANKLESITDPKSYAPLDPTPLSSILVPMTRDYIIYWGALVTMSCSHTILWIVSRAALAITVEDLNKFRKLQSSKSEPMIKNFRQATSSQGRFIFHVNPSAESDNLLLPGTIEPPGKPLVVNYSHMPELDPRKATSIYGSGVGDFNEKIIDKLSTKRNEGQNDEIKKNFVRYNLQSGENKLKLRNSFVDSDSTSLASSKTAKGKTLPSSPPNKKNYLQRKTTQQKKETVKENNKKTQKKEQKEKKNKDVKFPTTKKVSKEENCNICISKVSTNMSADSGKTLPITEKTEQTRPDRLKTPNTNSRLPVPKDTNGLQSSLAKYFKPRPKTACSEKNTPKLVNKPTTPKPKDIKRPITSSIPKPIRINASRQ